MNHESRTRLVAPFYMREFRKALKQKDETTMRAMLAKNIIEASRQGVAIPEDAASMIGRLLVSPVTKTQGGQFLSPHIKALRYGQAEALMLHTKMNKTTACRLVAAAWSDDPDQPLHYKTILNGFDSRETAFRECGSQMGGLFRFQPRNDPEVDALMFSDTHRTRILYAAENGKPYRSRLLEFFQIE
jgi:hypothetical protein